MSKNKDNRDELLSDSEKLFLALLIFFGSLFILWLAYVYHLQCGAWAPIPGWTECYVRW